MPIKFLNVPGSTNLRSSRPTGYKFPTGLNTITAEGPTTVDYLVVAGAGGGGSNGGGGGAGGYLTGTGHSITIETPYSITIGSGGAGATSSAAKASNGSNSIFSTFTALGGGCGGWRVRR